MGLAGGLAAMLSATLPLAADEGAGVGAGGEAATIGRIETAWRSWLETGEVSSGTLAISHHGDVIHVVGAGRDGDAPVDLASNSKAITATCLAALVREGALTFDTELGDIAGLDVPEGPLRDVTLAALISHSAGLAPDTTQDNMAGWLNETTPRHDAATAHAFEHGIDSASEGRYVYNNENYAILGAVIDAITDQPHETACATRVLAPAGVTMATLSPRFGAFAAWGGWRMSAADYLRFHAQAFGAESAIGASPATFPRLAIGQGLFYGMGTLYRPNTPKPVFFHTGALCFRGGPNALHYVAAYENGWAVSVAVATCATPERRRALDAALWNAAHE